MGIDARAVATSDGFDVRSLAITYRNGFVVQSHDHPWGQLIYGTSGVMQVSADHEVWFVAPTRAIWIPPRCHHNIVMQGEVAMRTLYLAPGRSSVLSNEVRALEVSPLLRELILHVHVLDMLVEGNAEHDRLAGVLVDIIANAPVGDLCLALPRDSRGVAAARWLQDNPAHQLDLKSVARQHGCSLRTLQRLFVKETGLTLEAWRKKARLIYAVTQLSVGTSVTEAAFGCGYESVSAFIAAFKNQFGITPGRYIV